MQERAQRNDSRSRRGSSSSRSSSGRGRPPRRNPRPASNVSGNRRQDMGSIRDERRRNGTPGRQRTRGNGSGRNGRGAPQGGYPLRSRNINFSGRRGYDPQIIIVAGVAIALAILFVFFIVSCAASCGREEANPVENVSESLTGDLRSAVEQRVTADYQSTYVAEHADLYPTELIQLMIDEPAATEFVFNYPNATREAQSYDDQVAKGSVPLLYDWDPRWGYVDYAGGLLGVTGSGPVSVAMARMALLGSADVTPATVATYVTQLGGANGDSSMAATLFTGGSGAKSSSTTAVDEDGDGYDDATGEPVDESSSAATTNATTSGTSGSTTSGTRSEDLASLVGLTATPITVEPGSSVTDTLTSAVEDGSYVLVETTDGAFGTNPHWALVIGANSDGSLGVYDPTSVANSTHPWDPGTVVDGSSSLVALDAPDGTNKSAASDAVDEDGDGYDDNTGEYIETTDADATTDTGDESGTSDSTDSTATSTGTTTGSTSTSGTTGTTGTTDTSGSTTDSTSDSGTDADEDTDSTSGTTG